MDGELVAYLDEKFGTIAAEVGAVRGDVKLLSDRVGTMEDRLTTLEDKFDTLQSSVDQYMKQGETYYQEMLALAGKVDRLERWLHQLADKVGVKLEY